jgi:hypothetical protein
MTLFATLLAATAEKTHPLLMPPIGFAAVAFAVFLLLGIVTWSFRDVANRHSQKVGTASHDSHDAAGH